VALDGLDADDQSGFYVGAGDINKDGRADIMTSSNTSAGFNNASGAETGEVYLVYGGASLGGTLSLANANLTVFGAAGGDRLGRSHASGDVNNDGYQDLVLGASRADPVGRLDAGRVYVIYGRDSFQSAAIQLSQSSAADVYILGDGDSGETCNEPVNPATDCADEAGHSTAIGDINGDSFDDIIVGALFANNGATPDAGVSYVIYGNNAPPKTGSNLYLPYLEKHSPGS
jgi:hypothetical protein